MNSLLERIDLVCEDFESKWIAGPGAPDLDGFLETWEGNERVELLRNLIPVDIHYRCKAGETPNWNDYVERYPELDLALGEESIGEVAAGVQFGDFVIERELGRGGMGVVYVALQARLDRRIALKVLPSVHALSAAAVERFHREARAAGGLHHANIVPVFEVGRVGNSSFIAMQLIDGGSLDDLRQDIESLHGAPLQPGGEEPRANSSSLGAGARLRHQWQSDRQEFYRSIARIGTQVADALTFAHSRGIIHRDIKPSNLLLDQEGRTWVADFGLAKVADSDLTLTGDVVGTLRYLSPERLVGECDERGDIYGVGASLYELISGRRIFAGSKRSTLVDSIERQEPIALRALDRHIPRDLETIVQRAIDKNPATRYQSAEILGDDLRRFLEDRPIHARPVGFLERFLRWRRHNRAVASLLLGVFALLLLSIGGATVAATIFSRQSAANFELAQSEGRARKAAIDSATQSRTTLYFAQMMLAGQAAEKDGGISVVRSFVDPWATPGENGHDPRGWEWSYLNGVAHQEQRILQLDRAIYALDYHPKQPWVALGTSPVMIIDAESGELLVELQNLGPRVNDVRWSPDGSMLAAAGSEQAVVWKTEDWSAYRSLPCQNQGGSVAWKPDGRQLAVECFNDEFIRLWDLASDTVVANTDGRFNIGGDAPQFDFSPDGSRIAVDAKNGTFRLLDGQTLDQVRDFTNQPGVLYAATFSSSGVLATATVDPLVRLWNPSTGEELGSLKGHSFRVCSVAWLGEELATGGWDYTVRLWNATERRLLRTFKGHTRNLRRVAWNPAGGQLISCGEDESVRFWDLEAPAPASTLREARVPFAIATTATWSESGRLIANLGKTGIITDASGRVLLEEPGYLLYISPDESLVALRSPDRLRIETWPAREAVSELGVDSSYNFCGAFSPDGSVLALDNINEVVLIDLANDLNLTRIPCSIVRDLSWSPNGELLAIASYESVVVIDRAGTQRAQKDYSNGIHDIDWDSSGQRLAIACVDQTARIVDAETLDIQASFYGHSNELRCVDWSPDERRLATGSMDGTVRVWDVETASLVLILEVELPALAVAWSPRGERLVAISERGKIHAWNGEPGGYPIGR